MEKEARKFILMPHGAVARFGSNIHRDNIQEAKANILDILDDPDIPDDFKLARYRQQKQSMLAHKQILEQPLKIGIHNADSMVEGRPTDALQAAIYSAGPNHITAQNLGNFLNGVDGLSWNNRGEVIIDGQYIPGSSLSMLLQDVIDPAPTANPRGSNLFAQVLRRAQVPRQLVRETTNKYVNPTHLPARQSQQEQYQAGTPGGSSGIGSLWGTPRPKLHGKRRRLAVHDVLSEQEEEEEDDEESDDNDDAFRTPKGPTPGIPKGRYTAKRDLAFAKDNESNIIGPAQSYATRKQALKRKTPPARKRPLKKIISPMRKHRQSSRHPFNPPIFVPEPFAASPDHIFPRPRLYKEDEDEPGKSPGSHPCNKP